MVEFACGDGNVTAGEECDDGNKVSGDGCKRDCTVEAGYTCTGSPASVCATSSTCGDGIVDSAGGETCDTGGVSSEGCVNCAVDPAWVCPVPGSPCFRRNCSAPLVGSSEETSESLSAGEYAPDCMGVCGGFARVDDCGVCAGGTSFKIPDSDKDDCGVCFGKNLDKDSCNVCFGNDAAIDACGVCHGTNSTCTGCDGILFSTLVDDVCGICNGNGSTCMGCDGVPIPEGGKIFDICGICGGTNTEPQGCRPSCGPKPGGNMTDCAGVCGGNAYVDDCGICITPGSGQVPNEFFDPRPGCGCFGGHGASLPFTSPNECGFNCPGNNCTGESLNECGEWTSSPTVDNTKCQATCGGSPFISSDVGNNLNYDECGVCAGDGSTCTDDIDCQGTPNAGVPVRYDCAGQCTPIVGDRYSVDDCGACTKEPAVFHKSVSPFCGCFIGKSKLDECGNCPESGGSISLLDECRVCAGGNLGKDECGVCFGYNQRKNPCGRCQIADESDLPCLGCDYVPNSNRTVDRCGVCGGDHSSCAIPANSTSDRFFVLAIMGGGSLCLLCLVGLVGFLIYRRRQRSFVSKYERQRATELGNHPTGQVSIVFTDIEGSTSLWENFPSIMPKTIETHHSICRRVIIENNGYEVKTEGDAFMIAFHQPIDAVRFATKTQLLLLKQKWPAQIMSHPFCATERDAAGNVIFRGLRVRMGIHTGYPSCRKDDNTGIMDYFGSMVNRAARVEHAASGGQILASARTYESCRVILESPKSPFVAVSLGEKHFKGIKGRMGIYQIMPKQLASRSFKAVTSYQDTGAGAAGGAAGSTAKPKRGLFDNLDESSSSEEDGFDAFKVGAQRASTNFW